MCGIAGFFERNGRFTSLDAGEVAARMASALQHRGPDDSGVWLDQSAGIALAHRRLAIIDLSPNGKQPMRSAGGRFSIVFNGEIFNYLKLRVQLEAAGMLFRGGSDTEVLLAGFECWGIEETIKKAVGMFAIALWDHHERELHLIRDRLGIKPVFWGEFGSLFIFGSELKALLAHPGWNPEIDRAALTSFLRLGYIPAPDTIYKGVRKLKQGHILTISGNRPPTETPYWNLRDVAIAGKANPLDLTDAQAVDQLEELLSDAVRLRMISDVPLGAFLSGGVDSSTVVALMQAQSTRPIKTFSIGFHEADYDEAGHAKAVARHLGTQHTEFYVEPRHAASIIPDLACWFDEPFGDSSQIPTLLLSGLTRKHVTVALSGDGGDELFAGYRRYETALSIQRSLRGIPGPFRGMIRNTINRLSPEQWDRLLSVLALSGPRLSGERMYKVSDSLTKPIEEIYVGLVGHWSDPASVVIEGCSSNGDFRGLLDDKFLPDLLDRMQFFDTTTYLADDVLTKLDRSSMAASLEARVPLLDHRVVEFSWRLPRHQKWRGTSQKWILQEVLSRYVPRSITERPKMGFGVPIDSWLRGPLLDWADDLLSEDSLRESELFHAPPIRRKWEEHRSGRANCQYLLWDVLMAQAWWRQYRRGGSGRPVAPPQGFVVKQLSDA